MIIYITGEHSFLDIDPGLVEKQEQWKIDQGISGRMVSFYWIKNSLATRRIFDFYVKREKDGKVGLKDLD